MARAAAVLSRERAGALIGLSVALSLYTAAAGRLWDAGLGWDVAFLALVLVPAFFLVPWLLLPLAPQRGLLPVALALVVLALLMRAAELDVLFNYAKLLALVLLGFWFLSYFEAVSWAVLIALVIPFVDAISVWRGPTEYIVSEQPSVFDDVSVAFRIPGENSSANIGPPDILFFSLFLAAAQRFGLRVGPTWFAMVALLGLTLVITATTDVAGLPALPAICVGFLLPNADLLWRAVRPARASSIEDLNASIDATASIEDMTEQLLEIAALVGEAVSPLDVHPVVVGRLAVAYWAPGAHLTGEIDLVMPHAEEIARRLESIGFERGGRFWLLPGREIFLESSGAVLEPRRDGYDVAELASGRRVRIQSAEEILVLRMREFVAQEHAEAYRQSLWLLGSTALDSRRATERADQEGLTRALAVLQEHAERLRGGSALPETWELAALARSLRTQ